jgi:two-component system, LytTR family, response regulator
MLKAVIVDDEALATEGLETMLKKYCPDVAVVGIAHSVDEAEKKIVSTLPDLVFLDIEMPFGDGFSLLNRIKHLNFDVIFTTAYNQYALKAIKHNALDYLLKPINRHELMEAVNKCIGKKNKEPETFKKLEKIITAMSQMQTVPKLAVPYAEGIIYLELDNILYFEGDRNYTHIHLLQGQKLTTSKNLKEYEQYLPPRQFFRIHKTHIINLNCVKKYIKGIGGEVILSDGSSLEVSRQKKEELLNLLKGLIPIN